MSSNPSGSITLQSTLNVGIPAGGNVITPYNVPVQPTQTHSYSAGTGANQINKVAELGGSAAASPASIDLTTAVCVDGTTGFAHWREILVFNDDPTNVLKWDFTATNANTAMFNAGGTTANLSIQPGTHQRFTCANNAAGYVVDSTHKVIKLDPGANTIAYRVVVAGD
jgi:hypothetical protein